MYKRIDGKAISADVRAGIAEEVKALNQQGVSVGLAVIIVGEDPASKIYVANKKKACAALGIVSEEYALPEDTDEATLLHLIDELNHRKEINGILCQLPLPKHLDEKKVINAILPAKDVDAFHPQNVGHIMIGDFDFVPCTPAGIIEMLHHEDISVEGKNCVVLGRSNIVGKPMAMLLMHENGTVTVTHRKTKNLKEVCLNADILVSSVGKPNFVTADMVKEGAVVIDVGINRVDGKVCGDVDFDRVAEKTSAITPVPGGVGPMTITMLMKNTLTAAKRQNGILK
ncbi:MAG: bifunctional methylenetetrahydrofolate dehydrogenase/methenyltetrahydrofolate cyclohydrolase FolD [Clostridia bacterium]|nr:bifunctional methylenetetrahydrofolate dehydrogenase/methenyltetrahydrofolate cyclohydrolase FolD [Clostridia bacterium]